MAQASTGWLEPARDAPPQPRPTARERFSSVHPLVNRGEEYFVVALTSRIYVALYSWSSAAAMSLRRATMVDPIVAERAGNFRLGISDFGLNLK